MPALAYARTNNRSKAPIGAFDSNRDALHTVLDAIEYYDADYSVVTGDGFKGYIRSPGRHDKIIVSADCDEGLKRAIAKKLFTETEWNHFAPHEYIIVRTTGDGPFLRGTDA